MKNIELLQKLKIRNYKSKKSGKKRIVAGITILCLVVAGIAGSVIIRGKGRDAKAAEQSVNSAQATLGTIRTTVTGTGSLATGSAQEVTIPIGVKIKEILVEEGEAIEKGQKLATLDEASVAAVMLEIKEALDDVEDDIDDLSNNAKKEGTTEYYQAKVLYAQRKELKSIQKTLKTMLNEKAIKASTAGIVSGINVSEGAQITEASDDTIVTGAAKTASASNTGKESDGGGIMLLSGDGSTGSSNDEKDGTIKIDECSMNIAAPTTGGTPQTKLSESEYFSGTLSWNCSTDTFQADTAYTATIVLTAKDGYAFSGSIIPSVPGADVDSQVVESDSGKSILKIKAKFSKTSAQETSEDASKDQAQKSAEAENANTQNEQSAVPGSTNKASAGSMQGKGSVSASGGSIGKGISASAGGVVSSAGSANTSSASTSVDYSEYEAVAFSIAAEDETVVSIHVDELDITSVAKGQSATITLDALEDQEFEGTITKVSQTAVSGSSSVKYPVEITLTKTEDMLLGMSASATINVSEAENVVLVPANAIQERGNSVFVYTEKDKDGNLSGETEVETGLSDGNQVEITKGLSEGDTVYYTRSDSDNSGMPDMSGFPEMPGGSGPPSGSGAPGGFGGPNGAGRPGGDK